MTRPSCGEYSRSHHKHAHALSSVHHLAAPAAPHLSLSKPPSPPPHRWFFPLLIVLTLLLFSVACRFLSRMLADANAITLDAAAVKLFIGAIAVAALGMYVAASIAGAGMGLSDVVVLAMIALIVSAFLCVDETRTDETRTDETRTHRLSVFAARTSGPLFE